MKIKSVVIPWIALILILIVHHSYGTEWFPINSSKPQQDLYGTWINTQTGHLVSFSDSGYHVFHVFDDYCIQDTGVVPPYSLYSFGEQPDQLLLHYFDYRDFPELLQAPLPFQRVSDTPFEGCPETNHQSLTQKEIFDLVWEAYDHHYAFFDEREVDWDRLKGQYMLRVAATTSDTELHTILCNMLSETNDGHVNLRLDNQSCNAGIPSLRLRLRERWKKTSQEDSTEQDFVWNWHQHVLHSAIECLDPDTHISSAADALEWGIINKSVGYVRINRFSGFTQESLPREVQYKQLNQALEHMLQDIKDTTHLILDVALNGGGSDAAAMLVSSYFADQSRIAIQYQVKDNPPDSVTISPITRPYTKPIYLITSEVTASAAESFVIMMRAFPHVHHVGEVTRGGISSLLPKPFPRNFMATISYQSVLDAEGNAFEGSGVPPAIPRNLFPDEDIYDSLQQEILRIASLEKQ